MLFAHNASDVTPRGLAYLCLRETPMPCVPPPSHQEAVPSSAIALREASTLRVIVLTSHLFTRILRLSHHSSDSLRSEDSRSHSELCPE